MSFVTVTRGGARAFIQAVMAQDAAAIAAQDAEIARRVRLEVTRLRDKAEAEGRAQGDAAARAAIAPALASLASARDALAASCAQLAAPLASHAADIAGLVTELAFLLARHIIGAAPSADISAHTSKSADISAHTSQSADISAHTGQSADISALISHRADSAALTILVTNLLAEAQAARGPRQRVFLHINPVDRATLLAHLPAHLPADTVTLCDDSTITAGGARLELLDPQGDPLEKIEWDATLEGRFTTIRDVVFPNGPTADGNPAGPA